MTPFIRLLGRAPRLRETNQQEASVRARPVAACVGEVQVLRDQKATGGLCRVPHISIVSTDETLGTHRVDIMS
jgi:hypothetical protein